ncbi:Protein DJ-1-like D [Vitis vinifera]|uniref:Protein DJ-1-like D n=1 Tax=Vitis vinifera TaxID=29760 RepID=A0A438H147_VITVI|nr:Protein DJ-1-like D [Vitis vinifera]
MAKSVLILRGDYMEDYEVVVPYQALLAYGVFVHIFCPEKKADDACQTVVHQGLGHQTYSESRGHNFTVDATSDEIDASKYDGLFIPGGQAPKCIAMNESVLDLVCKFFSSGKPIASICHGQLTLELHDLHTQRWNHHFPLDIHLSERKEITTVLEFSRILGRGFSDSSSFITRNSHFSPSSQRPSMVVVGLGVGVDVGSSLPSSTADWSPLLHSSSLFALDSVLPRPVHRRSEKLKGSKSLKQWDSLTTKFSAGSNLPFQLLQLPQIIPNARNLLAENESALFAVPWLGMLTGDTSPHIVFNRRLIISSEPR